MILQAKNISKRYGNHLVVEHIHLQFEKRTFNAILEPNGEGNQRLKNKIIDSLFMEVVIQERKMSYQKVTKI